VQAVNFTHFRVQTFTDPCLRAYGRSGSGNEFCAEEGQNPIFDPLPRNEKLCGNLFRKIALRNGVYPFRSTVFVPMEF